MNFFLPIQETSIKIEETTFDMQSTIKNKIMLFNVLVCPSSSNKKTFENLITKIMKVKMIKVLICDLNFKMEMKLIFPTGILSF